MQEVRPFIQDGIQAFQPRFDDCAVEFFQGLIDAIGDDRLLLVFRCLPWEMVVRFLGVLGDKTKYSGLFDVAQDPLLKQDPCSGCWAKGFWITERTFYRQNIVAGYGGSFSWKKAGVVSVRMVCDEKGRLGFLFRELLELLGKEDKLIDIAKPFAEPTERAPRVLSESHGRLDDFNCPSELRESRCNPVCKESHAGLFVGRVIADNDKFLLLTHALCS